MEDQSSVYSEKKLASYETTYKEGILSKPQDISVTLTAAHIYGQGFICSQIGTKEADPEYSRFVCGYEEITKIYINSNNRNSPIYIQCDSSAKSILNRRRIILPSFHNNEEIVKIINSAKSEFDKKAEKQRSAEKDQRLKDIEEEKIREMERRKKAADAEFENMTSGYSSFAEKEKPKPAANFGVEDILGLDDIVGITSENPVQDTKPEEPQLDEIAEIPSIQEIVSEEPIEEPKAEEPKEDAPKEKGIIFRVMGNKKHKDPEKPVSDFDDEDMESISSTPFKTVPEVSENKEETEVLKEDIKADNIPEAEEEEFEIIDDIIEERLVAEEPEPVKAAEPVTETVSEPVPVKEAETIKEAAPSKQDPERIESMSLEEFQTAVMKLKTMLDSGILTNEEFAAEKAKLMKFLY